MTNPNSEALEAAIKYAMKVGYNYGWSANCKVVKKPYEDDFGATFDLDTLREPDRSTIRAALSRPAVPEGYVLVPRECIDYLRDPLKFDKTVTGYVEAMLLAAQPPQASEKP